MDFVIEVVKLLTALATLPCGGGGVRVQSAGRRARRQKERPLDATFSQQKRRCPAPKRGLPLMPIIPARTGLRKQNPRPGRRVETTPPTTRRTTRPPPPSHGTADNMAQRRHARGISP